MNERSSFLMSSRPKQIGEPRSFPLSPWGEGQGEGVLWSSVMRSGATDVARSLRRNETNAERMLWAKLRNRHLNGWKFKRQVPFERFVLDFFCFEARLAVEVDGATHTAEKEVMIDRERMEFLNTNGIRVLRFWNGDILGDIEGVLDAIYAALGAEPAPSPGASRRPLPKGRGDAEDARRKNNSQSGEPRSFSLSPTGEGQGEEAVAGSEEFQQFTQRAATASSLSRGEAKKRCD